MLEISVVPEYKRQDVNDNCRVSVRLTMHLETRDPVAKKEIAKVWEQIEDDRSVESLLKLIGKYNKDKTS